MSLLEQNQTIPDVQEVVTSQNSPAATHTNGNNGSAAHGQRAQRFVEHPAAPLNDADRDAFLELLDDESEPDEALRSDAEWFKTLNI